MHVHLGPASSASAAIWIAYARTILAQAMSHAGVGGVRLPEDVVEAFEAYLDAWERTADEGPEFSWSDEVDPDGLEELIVAWMSLAEGLAVEAERRGFVIRPPEGEEFNDALVRGLLEAFVAEGRDFMAHWEEIRARWPNATEQPPLPREGAP